MDKWENGVFLRWFLGLKWGEYGELYDNCGEMWDFWEFGGEMGEVRSSILQLVCGINC